MAIFSSPMIGGCRPLVAIRLHDMNYGIVPEKVLESVTNKVLSEDGDLMGNGTCEGDSAGSSACKVFGMGAVGTVIMSTT